MRLIIFALTLLGVAACGGDEQESAARGAITEAVDAQKQALDQAKQVEQQVLDAAEQQRRAINRQSGDDEDTDRN